MTISKSKLKAQALEIFRRLEQEGGEVIVTDHGKASLVIRPYGKTLREVFPLSAPTAASGLDSLNEPTSEEWGDL